MTFLKLGSSIDESPEDLNQLIFAHPNKNKPPDRLRDVLIDGLSHQTGWVSRIDFAHDAQGLARKNDNDLQQASCSDLQQLAASNSGTKLQSQNNKRVYRRA